MGTDRGFLYWLSMNEESLGNSVAVSPLELYHAASPIVSIAFEDGRPCLLLIGIISSTFFFSSSLSLFFLFAFSLFTYFLARATL